MKVPGRSQTVRNGQRGTVGSIRRPRRRLMHVSAPQWSYSEGVNQMRPVITLVEIGGGQVQMSVQGRFGGGYLGIFPRQQAVAMLARDAKRYDCGEEPIRVTAPEDMMKEAGLL